MTRLVIHAGFHKTGTTTVQTAIAANRGLLERRVRPFLKDDFKALTTAARAFSLDPGAMTLAEVTSAAEAFFATLATDDPRPVLMSSEDLSGHLPGRKGLTCYDASALVMTQVLEAAMARFGPDTDVTFFFSTRGRDAWLWSSWWQNLRFARLREDFDSYSARIAAAADLPAVLAEVAQAVAPARVAHAALEDSSKLPQGPLTPILDLLDVPGRLRRKLSVPAPVNANPPLGLEPVFLELNRCDLDDAAVSTIKKHLLRLANKHRKTV